MGGRANGEVACGEIRSGSDDAAPSTACDVDGFWMDATEVTTSQFAEFVKATGYVTSPNGRRARKISRCAAGKPGCWRGGFRADRSSGPAERPLSMVELRQGRELAASARTGQRY